MDGPHAVISTMLVDASITPRYQGLRYKPILTTNAYSKSITEVWEGHKLELMERSAL